MKPWKTLSSRTEFKTPWFSIRADRCEGGDGRSIDPFYVMETFDWVHVVAVTPDRRLIVVRQWRQGIKGFVEELPGGLRDEGEEPLATAKRELEEETGAVSENWVQVATLHPDPARLNNRQWTFLARDIRFEKAQSLDETEELDVRLVPMEEIPALIAAGRFTQSTQVASFFLADAYLKSQRAQ